MNPACHQDDRAGALAQVLPRLLSHNDRLHHHQIFHLYPRSAQTRYPAILWVAARLAIASSLSAAALVPNYVVDHIVPLRRGVVDEPFNMQWQTVLRKRQRIKSSEPHRSPMEYQIPDVRQTAANWPALADHLMLPD